MLYFESITITKINAFPVMINKILLNLKDVL